MFEHVCRQLCISKYYASPMRKGMRDRGRKYKRRIKMKISRLCRFLIAFFSHHHPPLPPHFYNFYLIRKFYLYLVYHIGIIQSLLLILWFLSTSFQKSNFFSLSPHPSAPIHEPDPLTGFYFFCALLVGPEF